MFIIIFNVEIKNEIFIFFWLLHQWIKDGNSEVSLQFPTITRKTLKSIC